MQEPIPLFTNHINIEENKCSICLENLAEDKHKITECGHEYHNNCLISWLRSGNTSCPICRNDDGHVYFSFNCNKDFLVKSFIEYSKKNKMDSKIVKELNKYKKLESENTFYVKEIKRINRKNREIVKDFSKRKKDILLKYKKDIKEIRKEETIVNKEKHKIFRKKWKNEIKIRAIENNLLKIPLCPIKLN